MHDEPSNPRVGWLRHPERYWGVWLAVLVLILGPLAVADSNPRLAQIEEQLDDLQQQRNLLDQQLELAESGNYFFIPGDLGGPLLPIKQQDYVDRLRLMTGSGRMTQDAAESRLDQMHELIAPYRQQLTEELRKIEDDMEELRTEVRELDRASADPDPTSGGSGGGGQSGASAEDIARWRAGLECLEEGVRLYPNHWQDCNGNWTMGSRDVAIARLRSLLRDAGAEAGTGDDGANPPSAEHGKIVVISAVYGGNCGSPSGVTQQLADACEGKQRCDYLVDHQVIGDPAFGCRKDYVYRWQCAGGEAYPPIQEQTVSPEASGQYASLWCW
ncbi:hypothetical protein [Pseudomonas sp. 2FE]|uniref:hypothetical protein n=1 Tax=Pseudomonas sp. 2FE TaxID=2502190 RepID=UPI0010F7C2E1|nr:hypothetical protein [Pseudomonas sp. 2FE]